MSEQLTDDTPVPPAPVIDIHTHAMPMPFLRQLEREGRADLSGAGRNVLTLDPELCGLPPGAPVPLAPEQYDLARRLEQLRRSGVDHQVVAAPPFVFASESADERLVLDVTRRSNDAVAEFTAASGGRLSGLATVPVGVPGAVEELARCLDQLGMVGATMGSFGGRRELDHPVNEELWAALAERRCFTLLHPSRVSSRDRLADYHLVQLLGYPVETALATSRLIFGGVLDRHDLVLCLAHGGGCAPAVGARLDLGWHRKPVTRVVANAPTDYLRRLRYDTAVFDSKVLGRLVEDVTAANVLLGTDAPFDLVDSDPLRTVRGIGLGEDEEAAILGGNAQVLLPGLVLASGDPGGSGPGATAPSDASGRDPVATLAVPPHHGEGQQT
ncbi:aminocarboxymuconate-semialdehyde decarboxylase [Wenjunlia vitaminophila]|uniref:Aminocarboxymuconate-semialdehyde decarboxylase n=1 Tax=Wenjunlia vitaminophila TaxID=76728 RepID=A0A0T6LPF3_WENVI|nr:amidohydrolase family protein [Wenjunlia vitaminophila]KRV47860.1 aminocarboxymuconate-semialdehyde decarboxylase [Wenjunlia vitaminophila]